MCHVMPSLKFLHQTIAENFQLKVYNIARVTNWNSSPSIDMGLTSHYFDFPQKYFLYVATLPNFKSFS